MLLTSYPNDAPEEIPRSNYKLRMTLTGSCHSKQLCCEESLR